MYSYKIDNVFKDIINKYRRDTKLRVVLDKELPYYNLDFLFYFLNVFNYKSKPKPVDIFMKLWFKENKNLIQKTQEDFDQFISEMIEDIEKHSLKDVYLHDKLYLNLKKHINIYHNIPISFFRFILIDKEENQAILYHFNNSLSFWRFDIKNLSYEEYTSKNNKKELMNKIDEIIEVLYENFYFINNSFLMDFNFYIDDFYFDPNLNSDKKSKEKAKFNYMKSILKSRE